MRDRNESDRAAVTPVEGVRILGAKETPVLRGDDHDEPADARGNDADARTPDTGADAGGDEVTGSLDLSAIAAGESEPRRASPSAARSRSSLASTTTTTTRS